MCVSAWLRNHCIFICRNLLLLDIRCLVVCCIKPLSVFNYIANRWQSLNNFVIEQWASVKIYRSKTFMLGIIVVKTWNDGKFSEHWPNNHIVMERSKCKLIRWMGHVNAINIIKMIPIIIIVRQTWAKGRCPYILNHTMAAI